MRRLALGAALLSSLAACGGDDDGPVRFEDPGGPPEPTGEPVRVFSVGYRPIASDHESQASFRAAVRAKIDEDVIPSLSVEVPNLIVFPENVGLMAPLIGERGAAARDATTIAEAYVALSRTYDAASTYYLDRATTSVGPGRLVTLAVTDTLWRSLDCFAELAAETRAWVAVTYNVADAERVEDPVLADVLVDEGESDRSFAWVATGDEVPNQTLLYDPEGELSHRWAKEYLVPAEESALELAYGAHGNLRPAALPFGPVASVISKDAWMPDVLDRLALEGTRLMLQPEAFSGWGVPHGDDGAWAPDVVKESGWAHVMRYPEFAASSLPCLSANVFEMVFDCQSAVWVDPVIEEHTGAFIGQDPDVGFAAVAPWVVEDDGVGTLEERRARLIETGERLLPGSGDPLENGYTAGSAWLDVDLSGEPSAQRRPAAATLEDGTLVVVWEDTRNGQARLYGTRVADGVEEDARVRVPTEGTVRAPRLATDGDRLHLVWQERVEEAWQVRYARSTDGGQSFPRPVTLSDPGADAWVPDVAADSVTGAVHVAWIDTREGAGRVWVARSMRGDGRFEAARAVEPPAEGAYDTRHNRWSPSVAARDGTVVLAWTDFRTFAWDIRGAASTDGGETFGEPVRLDDALVPHETLHSDPRTALTEDGAWLVVWTDLRVRRPDYDVRARRLSVSDPGAGPESVVLASTDDAARPQWEPSLAVDGARVVVAWQDFRTDRNRIRAAVSTDGGETFADDVAVGEGVGYAPAVVLPSEGPAVVVHESLEGPGRRLARTTVSGS